MCNLTIQTYNQRQVNKLLHYTVLWVKVIEIVKSDNIQDLILTYPNQFGFKMQHGTDQCIYDDWHLKTAEQ